MERFSCRTEVVSGPGAVKVLQEYNCRRLLVATESRLLHTDTVREIVRSAGSVETVFLTDVDAEPTMKQAVEASRRIREFSPDLMVAVGARYVLDWGKAAACFSKQGCILASVPTAVGSGSEVTPWVTLTHNGRRHLLRDQSMRPDIAILEHGLTESHRKTEVAEDGFEMLAAALEAYAGMECGFLKTIHAREAFTSGWGALPAAVAGTTAALRRMQIASVLTGLATADAAHGLCRAMENSLGIVFGVSRGKAAAMLLPAVIGCNAHAAGRRYAELSRAAGLGGSREDLGVRNLRSGLVRLRRDLNLPGTLVQAGVDIRSVWNNTGRIVELTLEDPVCRNNPVTADDFVVRRILDEITGRI